MKLLMVSFLPHISVMMARVVVVPVVVMTEGRTDFLLSPFTTTQESSASQYFPGSWVGNRTPNYLLISLLGHTDAG